MPAWLSISPDLVDSGLPALYLADAGVGRRSLPLPLSFPGHFGLVLQVVEIAVDNYVDKELSDGSVLRPSCCTASPGWRQGFEPPADDRQWGLRCFT